MAGKAIAGGVPMAVYGFTAELARRMEHLLATKPAGHSGMGTTLAANALATAALFGLPLWFLISGSLRPIGLAPLGAWLATGAPGSELAPYLLWIGIAAWIGG